MKLFDKYHSFCVRFLSLLYLNFLWVMGVIVGLLIFGIGPSTYAMFAIIRQWFRGNSVAIFSSFIHYYKEAFKEKQPVIVGIVYSLVAYILYVDYVNVSSGLLKIGIIIGFCIYLISTIYIFPILVHYNWSSLKLKIKMSFLFGLGYLQYTLVYLVILSVIYIVFAYTVPLYIYIVGASFNAYLIMWIATQVFTKIEEKNAIQE